jgi:hypothetical protein
VGREEDGRPVLPEVPDEVEEELLAERVEAGERLVENRERRAVDQRRDELDPLLVPLRKGVEAIPLPVEEPDAPEPLLRPARRLPPVEAPEPAEVDERRQNGDVAVEAAVLGQVARRLGGAERREEPPIETSMRPSSGRMIPTSILTVVVFPAPFGPRRAKTSPDRTSNERSSTTVLPAKLFPTLSKRIAGCMTPEDTRLRSGGEHRAGGAASRPSVVSGRPT